LVVYTLRFEENDGIRSGQRCVHETLGIVWRGWKDHLQARYVCADAGPVLAVLGAVLGADRDSKYDRHRQQSAGHRLPLGELVEYLVAGAPHKVAVHQFDERRAAFHAITDGSTDDGTLGDRAVEQPMVWQRLRKAAID